MFFKLNEENFWIFTIENKTAEALTPRVEPFDIHKGGYLSFIPVNNRFDPPFIRKSGR